MTTIQGILKNSLKSTLQHQLALALMLISLHGVLMLGFQTPLQKSLLIIHYGFFLLWQPIWRAKDRLSIPAAMLFLAGGLTMIFSVSWWLIAFWLCGLFGLLGGRVFSTKARGSRFGYMLAASYLLAMLLLWVVPKLISTSADILESKFIIEYLVPVLPIAIFFTRLEPETAGHPPIIDFFYTLLLLFLAVILVLGSFAIAASSEAQYGEVLLKVLIGLSLTLLGISWLWNPRAGFAGIGQFLSKYFLSVGLPFEQWVKNIAELAEEESSPKEFTLAAMREVAALPWVSGVTWDTPDSKGELGLPAKFRANLDFHEFHLRLYTRWPLTPALTIHVKLLAQILGEFYEAKRREETLKQHTYMQAVYETGSRLTHDIKNLVQSMSALCSAAENATEADNDRLLALLKRQLPQLNQRLALTLDKLEAPNDEGSHQMKLSIWWDFLKQRYASSPIEFISPKLQKTEIDADVLDSVIDNLLQNAIDKSKNQPGIKIKAEVVSTDTLCIEISDDGKAMPSQIAENLFKRHVSSENGLGIGLFHAAKQAERKGYSLTLTKNSHGEVRFRLEATQS